MAKLFKIQAYIVDPNGEFDTDDRLEDCLIYCTQNDLNLDHLKIQSVDLGEWDDDLPINKFNCPESEFQKYFKEN
jgi:hypothetical protein